ncbi:hypothetical protein [Planctomycetes bacterium K23_9]|uniref:Uncharacterized protein n=1 Tax=Stieleria marina TaxID=1930275 RepID=A0A517NP99_9BACT|nr:hypothetical protein K239x_08890 [Planctomycetes bacterium K23_9]
MFASHLLGLTLLVATASFVLGVFVAYAVWGYRSFEVQDLEASITASRAKAVRLREEQSRLHARLQEA